ncbi:hypothetical protein ACLMNJ_32755 [Streptomyces seoulensis]
MGVGRGLHAGRTGGACGSCTAVRAALLGLVARLGRLVRHHDSAARALTLPLKFAGGTSWEKSRRLPAWSGHDEDLRTEERVPGFRIFRVHPAHPGGLVALRDVRLLRGDAAR